MQQRDEFWDWFAANGDRLRGMVFSTGPERDAAFAEMREAVASVEEGLILEFDGGREGAGRLIVSADGRPDLADAVKDLVEAAQAPGDWEVVAFRPRLENIGDMAIEVAGQAVGTEDVWYDVHEDDHGLAVTLYVRGLTGENHEALGTAASLLMAHAVGEWPALVLISGVWAEPLPPDPEEDGLRPLGTIVAFADEAMARRYPPPGSLPEPSMDDWLGMHGTVDDAPCIVTLNRGYHALAGHPDYDHRVTVSIQLNDVEGQSGLAGSEEEMQAVQELGDRLAAELTDGQQALHVMTVNSGGTRDLILYTCDAGKTMARLEAAAAGVDSHEIEAAVERESFWNMYHSFLHAAESGSEEEEEADDEG